MRERELEEVARLIEWARDKVMKVRRVATDERVRRSLRSIAFSLHPYVNPRIAFLDKYDPRGRTSAGKSGRERGRRDGK